MYSPRRPLAAAICLLVAVAGCATPPETAETAEAEVSLADPAPAPVTAPEDLTVDAIVLFGRDRPGADTRPEPGVPGPLPAQRPGRFVVFPDGSLFHRPGAPREDTGVWLEEPIRDLSRRQMDALWQLARDLGFADAGAGAEPRNRRDLDPPRDGILFVLDFTADGRRWVLARAFAGDETPDAATTRFVNRLGELAWATEPIDMRLLVVPTRYDLGDDPYSRYR